jgi:hypothetical protein
MVAMTSNQPGTPRSAADVLAEWRDAERRIEDQPAGTPAWHRARLEAAGLADEYQMLVAELAAEARELGANPSTPPSNAAADPLPVRPTGLVG